MLFYFVVVQWFKMMIPDKQPAEAGADDLGGIADSESDPSVVNPKRS